MSSSTLEPIVTSLHWSKELQKAGWPQDSFFWFYHIGGGIMEFGDSADMWNRGRMKDATAFVMEESYAAPTAEEILRRLPFVIAFTDAINTRNGIIRIRRHYPESYSVDYVDAGVAGPHCKKDTLANAAAAMTCYLVKQGLLSFNK